MLVKIINTVLQDTYTTDELTERVALMREHYGALTFTPSEAGRTVRDRYANKLDTFTLGVLSGWEDTFRTEKLAPKELYEAMDSIEQEVSTIPSVVLYLPVHFSPEHIAGFGKWFRENTKPNLLLTVRTDSRVSGGCAFIWNDKQYDFSLRYFLKRHRVRLVAMITKNTHAA